MLLVPTRIGQSGIHGIGIFAMSLIARGTPIWRFTPPYDQEFDPAEIERMAPHVREFFDQFSYLDRFSKRLVLCFDNARFTNHSDDPNVGMAPGQDAFVLDIALRDIAPGEEITANYEDFEEGGRHAAVGSGTRTPLPAAVG